MADIDKDFDDFREQNDKPIEITVAKPNDELWLGSDGKPAKLHIVGEESKTYRRRYRDLERTAAKYFDEYRITKDDRFSFLAAMAGTVGWSGWEIGGGAAEFNSENLVRLYRLVHIRGVALTQIRKHGNFFEQTS